MVEDNVGNDAEGIAEMAGMDKKVRNVTDPLDAIGNTTKVMRQWRIWIFKEVRKWILKK